MNDLALVLARAVEALDKSQWKSPEEIAALQRKQLVQLAKHCEEFSPHFRNRLQGAGLMAGDFAEAAALAKLPLLSRRALQSRQGVYCTNVPQAHMPLSETRTSGSTGEPVAVKRTRANNIDWLATTMREHLWHRRDFGAPFCAIRANVPKAVRYDSWGAPAALLHKTGPLLGIPITMSIDEQIAHVRDFRTQILLVYPNILNAFVQRAEAGDLRLPDLRQILAIGETLAPDLRRRAAAAFGVEIADMYSSQEAGNIAVQCPESGHYHVMAENLIVELVDAGGREVGEGETGRIVITDLHNYATPLIRYDIGDYATAGPSCSCGRGLPTLTRILGRERNLILMPDGSRHWPLVGFHKFRAIAPVVQYQMVQEERERIELRLVVERPLTADEERALIAHVQASLGHAFAVRLTYFAQKIPVGAGGKFEEFVCRAR
ncbi:MAG: phenylacetate--CoA ligase family protein [Rhizomicrobium sp.]